MLVIAAIDLIDGRCVRLVRGDYAQKTEYLPDPIEQALHLQKAGFSRIHIVDLDGARLGALQHTSLIGRLASTVYLPVQVGGGIRTSEDVAQLADLQKCFLIIGSSALLAPKEVEVWIETWGCDRFIVSLDLDGEELRTHGWKKRAPLKLQEALGLISGWGLRQVICTDISRDGTLSGPSLGPLERLVNSLSRETMVIAAGGVSRPDQIAQLADCGVGGVIIGRALYEGNIPEREFACAG